MKESNPGVISLDGALEFVAEVDACISCGRTDDAFDLLFAKDKASFINWCCLDLIQSLFTHLRRAVAPPDSVEQELSTKMDIGGGLDSGIVEPLESMLGHVVKIGKPKEVLLGLLECLELLVSSGFNLDLFRILTKCLKTTMLKLPDKRGDTLKWAFSLVSCCLGSIAPPPNSDDYTETDAVMVDYSEEVTKMCNALELALEFCEPFIDEATVCQNSAASNLDREGQKCAIAACLGHIVQHLSRFPIFSYKSGALRPNIVKMTLRLITDFLTIKPSGLLDVLDLAERGKLTLACRFNTDLNEKRSLDVSSDVVVVLAYFCVYKQECCEINSLPYIYSPLFVMERFVPTIGKILRISNVTDLWLASTCLLESLTGRLGSMVSLSADYLVDNTSLQECLLGLISVTSRHPHETVRKSALAVFTRLWHLLESDGKIMIIWMIFGKVEPVDMESQWYLPSNGIKGYLIDLYRSELCHEIQPIMAARGKPCEKIFSHGLVRMVGIFAYLPNKEKTDILNYYDQIMAMLNLSRLLAIFHQNKRWIMSERLVEILKNQFLADLTRGIELSRAHYELELKNLMDDKQAKLEPTPETVAMGDAMMDSMAVGYEGKIEVINKALNSFDVMMSLVARVSELMDFVKTDQSSLDKIL